MITNHTQLLNYLVKKYNYQSYLEIGINEPRNNFDKILHPTTGGPLKVGVDPAYTGNDNRIIKAASDEFFNMLESDINWRTIYHFEGWRTETESMKFDLIFIDGLHHADQVERDFNNALACLNDGGRIIIHDTLPEHESTTHVPRDSKVWHGDVYKFAMNLSRYHVTHYTVNMDCGCTVVWKDVTDRKYIKYGESWEWYLLARDEAMNIIQPSEIETYL